MKITSKQFERAIKAFQCQKQLLPVQMKKYIGSQSIELITAILDLMEKVGMIKKIKIINGTYNKIKYERCSPDNQNY